MSYWHAHAERDGQRLPGSDFDAIEAESPDSAARRATRHFWLEHRQLFDHSDLALRKLVVVVAQHLPRDPERETSGPLLGAATRWLSEVAVSHVDGEPDVAAYDRTQLISIHVEPLRS